MNFLDDPQGAAAALDRLLDAVEAHAHHEEPVDTCQWCAPRVTRPPYGQLSPHDLDHFNELLRERRNDWFAAKLLRLIADADLFNRERLRAGFPYEVAAYERWFATEDPH